MYMDAGERLQRMPCPAGLAVEDWRYFLPEAGRFFREHLPVAVEHGWTEAALFHVHPLAPWRRYDVMGLLPLLAVGRYRVQALGSGKATVLAATGTALTFRPCPLPVGEGTVCLWDLR